MNFDLKIIKSGLLKGLPFSQVFSLASLAFKLFMRARMLGGVSGTVTFGEQKLSCKYNQCGVIDTSHSESTHNVNSRMTYCSKKLPTATQKWIVLKATSALERLHYA